MDALCKPLHAAAVLKAKHGNGAPAAIREVTEAGRDRRKAHAVRLKLVSVCVNGRWRPPKRKAAN